MLVIPDCTNSIWRLIVLRRVDNTVHCFHHDKDVAQVPQKVYNMIQALKQSTGAKWSLNPKFLGTFTKGHTGFYVLLLILAILTSRDVSWTGTGFDLEAITSHQVQYSLISICNQSNARSFFNRLKRY